MDDLKYIKVKDTYELSIDLRWVQNRPIACDKDEADETISVTFTKLSLDYWKYIETQILEKHEIKHKFFQKVESLFSYNFTKLNGYILQYVIKDWTLPIELIFDNEILTDECFEKVLTIHPNILRILIEKFEQTLFLTEADKDVIIKQSRILFKDGGGVEGPHEAISLYCDLTSFWDKFGLNYFDLQKLPYETYLKLKTVLQHETTFRNIEANKQPTAKLSGKQVLSQMKF